MMRMQIADAIGAKKLVEFHCHGHRRVAEPHILGTKDGVTQLLG